MSISTRRAAGILLAILLVAQIGIGLWHTVIIFKNGLDAGPRPLVWSSGLAQEVLLSLALAALAWWWLPPNSRRTQTEWAVRFLLFGWILVTGHYLWGLATSSLARHLSWVMIGVLFVAGSFARRTMTDRAEMRDPPSKGVHPALWLAVAFWISALPHLFFPYHWTDTRIIWACRTEHFDLQRSLTGVFGCPGPERPPLYSLLLWLGHTNPTIEGRLLPLLMLAAFGVVFYQLVARVAPRLAPWSVVWLFATNRVYQGTVSFYADVPVMLAVAVGCALAVDDGTLLRSRPLSIATAFIAGAAASLIKRDGLAMIGVASAVLLLTASNRRDLKLWAPLAGGGLAYLSWLFRPAWLYAPAAFPVRIDQMMSSQLSLEEIGRRLWTIFYGMQGQLFSHYAFGLFALAWIAVAVWLVRSGRARIPALAIRLGLAGLAGWVTVAGLYVWLTFTGHPDMGSLFIIRTGFARHLVHMYPLCLLFATAMAERLVTSEPRS